MRITLILGTRPEIIKLAPVIRELEKRGLDFVIIHSNQHFSADMDERFFAELKLPSPHYNLGVNNLDHGAMVGTMLLKLESLLKEVKPDWVIVQGDTNTVLAGALAAGKLGIKIAHVEAGLRSYDRTMPEEINRVVADHLSDLLFAPTNNSAQILSGEGIAKGQVVVSGNTIVDAVNAHLALASSDSLPKNLPQQYLLLTLHRPSNVDQQDQLTSIFAKLTTLAQELTLPIIFPAHPRTHAAIKRYQLSLDPKFIQVIEPVGYLAMLKLIEGASLILTDSGGIQEEACVLHIPCVTLRTNTERPETVEVGANILLDPSTDSYLSAAKKMIEQSRDWTNPFGDGHSSELIVDHLLSS